MGVFVQSDLKVTAHYNSLLKEPIYVLGIFFLTISKGTIGIFIFFVLYLC